MPAVAAPQHRRWWCCTACTYLERGPLACRSKRPGATRAWALFESFPPRRSPRCSSSTRSKWWRGTVEEAKEKFACFRHFSCPPPSPPGTAYLELHIAPFEMFWLNTEFQPQYGRFQLVRPGHDRLVPLHERPVRLLPIDVPRQMNRRFRPARCAVHPHDIADLVAWLPARNVRILLGQHWGRFGGGGGCDRNRQTDIITIDSCASCAPCGTHQLPAFRRDPRPSGRRAPRLTPRIDIYRSRRDRSDPAPPARW